MSQSGKVIEAGGSSGPIITLTGNTGGAITPVAGNINVVGDAITLSTAKNGAGTLLITLENTVAATLTTNDTAFHEIIPIALNIAGEAVQTIVSIVGTKSDYTAMFGVNSTFTAREGIAAGTATLLNVGASKGNTDSTATTIPAYRIVVSGTAISIQVMSASTAGVGETWNWKATVNFVFV